MSKLILKNIPQISTFNKLNFNLYSYDNFRIPEKQIIDVYVNEIPFPFIIDFGSALSTYTTVIASINGSSRNCTKLNEFGQYQLNFIATDFNSLGIKELLICFKNKSNKEYIKNKYYFNVKEIRHG